MSQGKMTCGKSPKIFPRRLESIWKGLVFLFVNSWYWLLNRDPYIRIALYDQSRINQGKIAHLNWVVVNQLGGINQTMTQMKNMIKWPMKIWKKHWVDLFPIMRALVPHLPGIWTSLDPPYRHLPPSRTIGWNSTKALRPQVLKL